MEATIQKTLIFGIFIAIGFLLKVKFTTTSEVQGLKKIILNLALPATIFIALMGVKIDYDLIVFPLMALGINFALFYIFPLLLPVLGFPKETPEYRSMRLMIPSLAPGLSCFPFISELLNNSYLAKAAMADLGNKIFVLIILYCVAMQMHYKQYDTNDGDLKRNDKLKKLLITLISEPVTLFILVALFIISFGYTFGDFPLVLQGVLDKLSALMTPLVMLFIGLSVKIKKQQFLQLFSVLLIRAGLAMYLSALFIWTIGISVPQDIIWILAFSLSACSFWPYAHIANIVEKEKQQPGKQKTFNGTLAINLLALSFPFSTLIIIGIMLNQNFMSDLLNVISMASLCIVIGALPVLIKKFSHINQLIQKGVMIKKID